MRTLRKVEPERYFAANDLSESLVVRIAYLTQRKEFELIISFARTPEFVRYLETQVKPTETPELDFRRLIFSDVSEICVSDGQVKMPSELLNYSAKDDRSILLQDCRIQVHDEPKVSLYFGTYGTFFFSFGSLRVDRKLARALMAGEGYVYCDADTGEEIDFYDPFE